MRGEVGQGLVQTDSETVSGEEDGLASWVGAGERDSYWAHMGKGWALRFVLCQTPFFCAVNGFDHSSSNGLLHLAGGGATAKCSSHGCAGLLLVWVPFFPMNRARVFFIYYFSFFRKKKWKRLGLVSNGELKIGAPFCFCKI